jgi:hypothetical protein
MGGKFQLIRIQLIDKVPIFLHIGFVSVRKRIGIPGT